MRTCRLGMIGAGVHATNILYPSLQYVERVDRVAVCDVDAGRAVAVARSYGFDTHYTDAATMLGEAELDAVIICVNAALHPALISLAIDHRVHTFVEKPPARSAADVEPLVLQAAARSLNVMVDFQKRRAAAYMRAADLIKQGVIGRPVLFQLRGCFINHKGEAEAAIGVVEAEGAVRV